MPTVVVRRQPGDRRSAEVALEALQGFHMRSVSGGVHSGSAHPALYAYMMCTDLPAGVEFGHSCKHGPPPHEIMVCMTQVDNPGPLYKQLRKEADPEWGMRKKPHAPQDPTIITFTVGRYGRRTIKVVPGAQYEVRPLAPNKKKHRGRKFVAIAYEGDKGISRFSDTGGRGRVDLYGPSGTRADPR